MTIDTELSDFNWHYLSQYGKIKFYAAGRLWDAMTFDKAPINPYRLACEFYARYDFSFSPDDFYRQGNRIRYKCIDDLVKENPEKLSDVGQMLYDGWLGFKKNLEAQRSKEPKLPTIPPPPPEPPKVEEPKKLPEVKVPKEPKKNPAPWLVKASVWFGIVSTVVGAVAWFVPGAKPWVAVIVPVIQAILKAFGV
jgi:hypothetical protein